MSRAFVLSAPLDRGRNRILRATIAAAHVVTIRSSSISSEVSSATFQLSLPHEASFAAIPELSEEKDL